MRVDEEERLLAESREVLKEESLRMKECLDEGKPGGTRQALSHAGLLLGQLRTTGLSPKLYYQLYMAVTDELRYLGDHLIYEGKKGIDIVTYYTEVQYINSILPRLYLLITVGRACVLSREEEGLGRMLLRDLVEMCRGVQHPLRGLFLRNYLLQCAREVLGRLVEKPTDETLRDCIEFVLVNFAEMNKLWVRMQHQGHSRDRKKREQERQQLKLLVGTNLVRLSEIDSISLGKYCKLVLPGILEQVVSCKDAISQEYLMDCLIQVFPTENHVATFPAFLRSCAKLQQEVNVRSIVIGLTGRLSAHFSSEGAPESSQVFGQYSEQIDNFLKTRDGLASEDMLQIEIALLNMALTCFPDENDYVDNVLEATLHNLRRIGINRTIEGDTVSQELRKLLSLPVESYNNILRVLRLAHYLPLLHALDLGSRKAIAATIANNVFANGTVVPSAELTNNVLGMLSALIRDPRRRGRRGKTNPEELDAEDILLSDDEAEEQAQGTDSETEEEEFEEAERQDLEDFADEQGLIARLVHHLHSEDPTEMMQVLLVTKKHILKGGKTRYKFTLPPLVFQAFNLAHAVSKSKVEGWEDTCRKLISLSEECLKLLAKSDSAELALKLYLQATLVVDTLKFEGYEATAYQLFSQAVLLYEEEMCNSKSQLVGLHLLVGTLCESGQRSAEANAACVRAANTLLKLADQCRAGLATAHLSAKANEPQGVLRALTRGVSTATKIIDRLIQAQLLVELLNHYLYFYEKGNSLVKMASILEVKRLIEERLPNLDASEESEQITKHFTNTLDHLQLVTEAPSSSAADSLAELSVSN